MTKQVAPGTRAVSRSGTVVCAAMTRMFSSCSMSPSRPVSPEPTETSYRRCGPWPNRGLFHSAVTPASVAANTIRSPDSIGAPSSAGSPRRRICSSSYSRLDASPISAATRPCAMARSDTGISTRQSRVGMSDGAVPRSRWGAVR